MNNSRIRQTILSLFTLLIGIAMVYTLFEHLRFPRPVEAVPGTLKINASIGSSLFPGGTWNSSGNVGIGTTAPGYKLDVNTTGNLGIRADVSAGSGDQVYLSGQAGGTEIVKLYRPAGMNGVALSTWGGGGPEGIFLMPGGLGATAGNVGIGTTAPGNLLDVAGTIGSSKYADRANSNYFLSPAASTNSLLVAGNVGIGTTGPSSKLDVRGQIAGQSWLNLWNTGYVGTLTGGDARPAITFGGTDSAQGWFFGPTTSTTVAASIMGIYNWLPGLGGWAQAWYPNGGSAIGTAYANSSTPPANGMIIQGNVGIGTVNPTETLHVVGSGFFTGPKKLNSGIGVTISYGDTANTGQIDSREAGVSFRNLAINANNFIVNTGTGSVGERMRVDVNGNVGIGTTSPGYTLDVAGNAAVHSNLYLIGANTLFQDNQATFQAKNSGGTYETWMWPRWSDNIMYTNFGSGGWNIRNNSSGSVMFMQSSGNVGIGTAGPGSLLELYNPTASSNQPFLTIGNGGGGAGNQVGVNFFPWRGRSGGAAAQIYGIDDGNASAHLVFATAPGGNGTSPTERMRIMDNGNVGIGTAGPGTKLDVGTSTSDTIRSYGGFVGNASANIGGTGAAAYFPNGAWLNGGNEWIYGGVTFNGAVAGATSLSVSGPVTTSNAPSTWGDLRTGSIDSNNVYGYRSVCVGNSSGTCDSSSGVVIGLTNTSAYTNLPSSGNSIIGGGLSIYGTTTISSGNMLNITNDGPAIDLYGVTANSSRPQIRFRGANGIINTVGNSYDNQVYMASNMWTGATGTPQCSTAADVGDFVVQATGGVNMFRWLVGSAATCATLYNALRLTSAGWLYAKAGMSGTGADYAEYFVTNNSGIKKGEILVTTDGSKLGRTDREYDSTMIGIVSTRASFISYPDLSKAKEYNPTGPNDPRPFQDKYTALDSNPYGRIVGLIGQVPAILSSVNGMPMAGDFITSSQLPGIGMKATKAGPVIAKVLESSNWDKSRCASISTVDDIVWPDDNGTNPSKPCFRLPDGTYIGKLMVYVNSTWYDPDIALTNTGDLSIKGDAKGNFTLRNNNSLVSKIGAFAQLISAKIDAGVITVKKLVVDGVDIAKKLDELSQKVSDQQKEIDDLKKEIQKLKK